MNSPHYVAERDIKTNTVVLAPENDQSLYHKEITLSSVNFINPGQWAKNTPARLWRELENKALEVLARVRYRQPLVAAGLEARSTKNEARIIFKKPQKFVAPGQSAVFYSQGGEMLGGGIIS
ncbi:MAG: hypothetical protein HYS88_00795 [Candidatus Colwellbacteria bacterium]|nr:hypothetical protein [Candidatus Colwellbacteria bacterium]